MSNPNLVKCVACRNEVAKGVKTCPTCGKDQRSWPNRHPILVVLFIVIAVASIGNALAPAGLGASSSSATKVKTLDHTVDVSEVIYSYNNNEVRGDAIYKSAYIEMSGYVYSINKVMGSTYLDIYDGGKYQMESVACEIKGEEITRAMNLNKNDKVKVRGTVTGKDFMQVRMVDCVLQ